MTDTLANNKLIAEFMGMDISELSEWSELPGRLIRFDGDLDFTVIEYDTSWDWLMPVVEKIESLGYTSSIYSNSLMNDGVLFYGMDIYDMSDKTVIAVDHQLPKLESAYYAVVSFIELYNEQLLSNSHQISNPAMDTDLD